MTTARSKRAAKRDDMASTATNILLSQYARAFGGGNPDVYRELLRRVDRFTVDDDAVTVHQVLEFLDLSAQKGHENPAAGSRTVRRLLARMSRARDHYPVSAQIRLDQLVGSAGRGKLEAPAAAPAPASVLVVAEAPASAPAPAPTSAPAPAPASALAALRPASTFRPFISSASMQLTPKKTTRGPGSPLEPPPAPKKQKTADRLMPKALFLSGRSSDDAGNESTEPGEEEAGSAAAAAAAAAAADHTTRVPRITTFSLPATVDGSPPSRDEGDLDQEQQGLEQRIQSLQSAVEQATRERNVELYKNERATGDSSRYREQIGRLDACVQRYAERVQQLESHNQSKDREIDEGRRKIDALKQRLADLTQTVARFTGGTGVSTSRHQRDEDMPGVPPEHAAAAAAVARARGPLTAFYVPDADAALIGNARNQNEVLAGWSISRAPLVGFRETTEFQNPAKTVFLHLGDTSNSADSVESKRRWSMFDRRTYPFQRWLEPAFLASTPPLPPDLVDRATKLRMAVRLVQRFHVPPEVGRMPGFRGRQGTRAEVRLVVSNARHDSCLVHRNVCVRVNGKLVPLLHHADRTPFSYDPLYGYSLENFYWGREQGAAPAPTPDLATLEIELTPPFCPSLQFSIRLCQVTDVDDLYATVVDQFTPATEAECTLSVLDYIAENRGLATGGPGDEAGGADQGPGSEQQRCTVLDPHTLDPIETPVRFRACRHWQCFDLHPFLKLSRTNPKMACPVCPVRGPVDQLFVDPLFARYVGQCLARGMQEFCADASMNVRFSVPIQDGDDSDTQ